MNIFFLDRHPSLCAEYHYDKHVVKMILESAQLLSTAHHLSDSVGPYKVTHANHPSAIWARSSVNHYSWLYCLMLSLGREYQHRYGKVHKTIRDHGDTLWETPRAIKAQGWQDPPQAMPEHCQNPDAVTAYRNYYATEKINLLSYTKRETPLWLTNKIATTVST